MIFQIFGFSFQSFDFNFCISILFNIPGMQRTNADFGITVLKGKQIKFVHQFTFYFVCIDEILYRVAKYVPICWCFHFTEMLISKEKFLYVNCRNTIYLSKLMNLSLTKFNVYSLHPQLLQHNTKGVPLPHFFAFVGLNSYKQVIVQLNNNKTL